MIRLILTTCKDFWLFDAKGSELNQKNLLKRRIGGLFLTYILYFAQPRHPGHRLRIQLDTKDVEQLKKFDDTIQDLNLRLDGETEGNGFFLSLCVISGRLRTEACELAVVPVQVSTYLVHSYLEKKAFESEIHIFFLFYIQLARFV